MMNLINSNQDPSVELYPLEGSDKGDNEINSLIMEPSDTFLMGVEVISTILARENNEFIKSSVDDLVPIPRESEVTSVYDELECDMPITISLPTTDVREEDFDINSPLGEQVVDFLMENMDVAGLLRHVVKHIFNHLIKNPSLTKEMSDEPLGEHLDTLSTRDREIDFNPSRDIEELERLLADDPVPVPRVFDDPLGNSDSMSRSSETNTSSNVSPTLLPAESSSPVLPLPNPRQVCLREVERFDPFFSLTQSEIPSDESKVHIEVFSVLWGNKLPIPDGTARCPNVD
ncbi:hypothetical protein Tco_0026495 [Tanacetum coccineum]